MDWPGSAFRWARGDESIGFSKGVVCSNCDHLKFYVGGKLGARIIAIADAYDTITSERTYKKARSPGAALAEIQRCAGAQFDPQLVSMFTDSLEDQLNARAEPDAAPERSVLTDRAR